MVSSLAELAELLGGLDVTQPFPAQSVGAPRGRLGSPRRVVLPDGWLADTAYGHVGADAELATSGG
jgi:hypothetical protein